VVTGIETTTSGLLDQRRSRSDNQAPTIEEDNAFTKIPETRCAMILCAFQFLHGGFFG